MHKGDSDLRIQLFSMVLFNLWKSGSRTYWDSSDRNEDIDPDVSFHSTNVNTKRFFFRCITLKYHFFHYPIHILQLTVSLTSPDEYGLYMNTRVTLWLDSHSYNKAQTFKRSVGICNCHT